MGGQIRCSHEDAAATSLRTRWLRRAYQSSIVVLQSLVDEACDPEGRRDCGPVVGPSGAPAVQGEEDQGCGRDQPILQEGRHILCAAHLCQDTAQPYLPGRVRRDDRQPTRQDLRGGIWL